MEAKGFVRKADKLGRICLPIEFRRKASLKTGDEIEMIATGKGLLIRKYEEGSRNDTALKRLKDVVREDDRLDDRDKATMLAQVVSLEQAIREHIGEDEQDDA